MPSLATLTTFFGWSLVLNMGIYLLTVGAFTAMRGFALRTNAKIFGISEDEVALETFRYIGRYKLVITVFCFVPYLALKIME